VIDIIDARL